MLISEQYRDLLAKMHEQHRWGTKGHTYIKEFLPFCHELGCKTVLDYGSGSGTVKRQLALSNPELTVAEYDPAVECVSNEPAPADFLVCTDVMEHVEIEYVPDVLSHIYSLMLIGGYFTIGLTQAKRVLPDGRNAHITVYNSDWWLVQLKAFPWSLVRPNLGRKHMKVLITKRDMS